LSVTRSRLAVFALLALLLPATSWSVCIHRPIKVKRVRGWAYSAKDEKRWPVPGVRIKVLTRARPEGLVAEATSDEKGWFALGPLPPGEYAFRVEHELLRGLETGLSISRGWLVRDREIEVKLGLDVNGPCGGSSVRLVKPHPVSAKTK
jgi:hypothetical protein